MKAILDAGALVAVDRRNRLIGAQLRMLQQQGTPIRTSSAVVGQVWRDGRKQANLARVLAGVGIEGLGKDDGKRIGELLALSGSADIVDAHVALITAHADLVLDQRSRRHSQATARSQGSGAGPDRVRLLGPANLSLPAASCASGHIDGRIKLRQILFHDVLVRVAAGAEVQAWLEGRARPDAKLRMGELALAAGVLCLADAGGFDRHTCLCGQSGSGKTYSPGVILERLLIETDLRLGDSRSELRLRAPGESARRRRSGPGRAVPTSSARGRSLFRRRPWRAKTAFARPRSTR